MLPGTSRMLDVMRDEMSQLMQAPELPTMHLDDDLREGNASYSVSHTKVVRQDANGNAAEYQSHTKQARPSGEPVVSETNRKYLDSNGLHKLGVSRSVGDSARSLVRERLPDGTERSRTNSRRVSNPEEFERHWHASAHRAGLTSSPRSADLPQPSTQRSTSRRELPSNSFSSGGSRRRNNRSLPERGGYETSSRPTKVSSERVARQLAREEAMRS